MSTTAFFFLGFFVGIAATVLFISEKKKEDETNEFDPTMDDENEYYVKLPDKSEIVNIVIEEPLGLNHRINLDGTWYKVIAVEHKDNGHTVFILNWS